ncbi:MAG TPA: peptide ABC transporter substrate-binding protein [Peptococcaceae bacterium]|nr:MAG: Extracellular solute-binding protein family 5 [Clostridia bacterium 41_269]HBT20560.1 peptide ABC transporter substrate-binding protein [Peptococcaceae bacterium]
MFRKLLLGFLCAVISVSLFLITGCGQNDTESSQNKKEQVLTIGEMWAIDNIDPAADGTLLKEKALIVETLVECKPNFELKPGLAISWENVDGTTWKIKLRKGVRFHDGSLMTAEAVKWSLERALSINPKNQSFTKIKSIEAADDYTLIIKTVEPNADLPASLHYSNTAIISPNSVDQKGNLVKPIGTGPFKLKQWDPGTGELEAVKNENYWGGAPKLDRIVIRPLPDPNTRALAVEKGEIDFTCDPPYNELDRLSSMDDLNVEFHQTARNYILEMNLKRAPFSDLKVRKAISYAIDREAIVKHVLFGCGAPAKGPFMPGMAWTNENLKGYPYDPEKAKQILADAGWKDTNGDGVIDKDGKPFKVTLMTYSQRPGLPPMAQSLQAQLKKVGIDVKIEVMEWGAISERVKKGAWDMKLGASATAMIPTPSYYLQVLYYSKNNPDTGYHNAKVDQLIEACMSSYDKQEKYELSKQVQEIVEDELPVITIAHYGVAVVMKDKVKGYEFNPTAHDYMLTTEVFVEE